MKQMNLEEIKRVELKMLIAFDKFCYDHQIKYSLGAGTLIGAIRHQGYIPWDDDIDIFMMRNEYDQFIKLIKQGEKIGNYKVHLPDDSESIYPFIKITDTSTIVFAQNRKKKYSIGVWLDIFPVDCCGNSEEEVLKNVKFFQVNMIKLERSTMHYTEKSFVNQIKNVYLFFVQNILGYRYWKFKNRILQYTLPEHGKYYGTIRWPYYKGNGMCDVYPKEFFDGYTSATFEGYDFMIFQHYDEILTHRYGDYMKLPDEKDRVCHGMEAYWIKDEI